MKCFYHNDLDGNCAGAIVYELDLGNPSGPAEFIQMNYNMKFPIDTIKKDEEVYIVDYHIKPDEMDKLLKITEDVTWIDHHVTALEEFKNYPKKIKGLRKDGISGCVLTFMYLYNVEFNEVPMYIRLIGDRDVWKFQYGDDTRGFCMAMSFKDTDPESDIWFTLRNDKQGICGSWKDLADEGLGIIKNRDIANAKFLKSWGYECKIEGFEQYECYAVNKPQCGSETFNYVADKNYDIYISVGFNGDLWVCSMYSTTVDVGHIAKTLGGGGHKGAAGFSAGILALPIIKKKEVKNG